MIIVHVAVQKCGRNKMRLIDLDIVEFLKVDGEPIDEKEKELRRTK